jgi:methylated-DNA-protein-cysteine methyltransferase related protein
MAETGLTERVLAVVGALPAGAVVTYGEVAAEAGRPGAARAVGRVLARHGGHVPWWRVVTASGRLVPGAEKEQTRRLVAEGIACRDGHVLPSSTSGD